MTEHRKQWAAVTWPEMPEYLPPEAIARRAKVRIGIRALLTLPLMLAALFGHLSGDGSHDGVTSPASAAPEYPGDKIALSVRLELASHGLLPKGMAVDCDGSTVTAGAVSTCDEYAQSGDGGDVSFDIQFVDGHGHFSFRTPDGPVLKGVLVG